MSRALSLAETAAELKKSKRWLLEWLRAHPRDNAGAPFYTPVGRDKIFHHSDIARIEMALREGLTCHSSSGRRVQVKRRTTKFAERTCDAKWKLAAELTNDPSLSKSYEKSRNALKPTDNTQPPRLWLIQANPRS